MKDKRQFLIRIVLALIILGVGSITAYYWISSFLYVKTDDARVSGDLVRISPLGTGKLAELFIDDGSVVEADEIVGRIEGMNLTGSGVELSLIRSPINGTILKEQGVIGETVSAGQTLAYVMDTDKLYISANIEETKVGQLRPGQAVDITVDQLPGQVFSGTLRQIGRAANSVFSLLPVSTGSTFTKVTQRIPVIIDFDTSVKNLLAGASATVKIHIR